VTGRLRQGAKAAYQRLMGHHGPDSVGATPMPDAAGGKAAPPAPRYRFDGTKLDGFAAELAEGAIARLRRFAPYRDEDYVALNPDVGRSDLDPAFHAMCYGAFEGRHFFTIQQVTRSLAEVGPTPRYGSPAPTGAAASGLGSVGVYVNSNGNAFMREIADDLTRDLLEAGVRARLLDETSSRGERHDITIFVAPHEFFTLGAGRQWMCDETICDAFMFGTEQVQTPWCAQSLPFIFMSRGVIDMSYQAAELFRATTMPAIDYLPSSYRAAPALAHEDLLHPVFRDLPDAARLRTVERKAFADRPIEIAFFGTESPRRNSFFAANADVFDAFSACFHVRSSKAGPIKLSGSDASLARLAAHVAGQTKIALNIHQDDIRYFEWHRLVRLGMANGCVVVTEPSTRQRGFTPGVHYLEETASRIPDLATWLLRSADGRAEAERVAANAIAVTSDRTAARMEVERLCRFLAENAGA
jgi:hypothetical protein